MLQLFLQTSAITAADWDKVYPQIVELAGAFPLQLIRIEAYDGFERDKQDKDHFDLVVNRGQIDEHLCIYGDWVSWTTGTSVRFYKNWSKHCELTLEEQKSDPTRPITWNCSNAAPHRRKNPFTSYAPSVSDTKSGNSSAKSNPPSLSAKCSRKSPSSCPNTRRRGTGKCGVGVGISGVSY